MPKRPAGPLRYATYSRCSSDDQAHKDFSTTDVQTTLNIQHVQDKSGTLYQEYKDEGVTGTTLKRPEFQRLLADAHNGEFDVVVVTYMSRLGRGNTYAVAEHLLNDAGVKVEMVKEQFTDDMAGFVTKQMTQFVDGMYVQQVRQWTRTKMEAMVKAGYVCGGTVPFGLKKELVCDASMVSRNDKEPPKRFVPHPDEAALVREAFELFAEVGSYPKVVAYLRSVTSRPWSIDTVSYMLRNVVYRGILKFGQWVNEKAHEPLISEELWLAVQEMDAKRPARSVKQDPVDSSSFYLRGLVFCSHCGKKMSPANHHGRTARVRYYECIGCVQKGVRQCPVRRINADSLHEAVVREIQRGRASNADD